TRVFAWQRKRRRSTDCRLRRRPEGNRPEGSGTSIFGSHLHRSVLNGMAALLARKHLAFWPFRAIELAQAKLSISLTTGWLCSTKADRRYHFVVTETQRARRFRTLLAT